MSLRRVGRFWAIWVELGGAAAWLGCNALAGIEPGSLEPGDSGPTGSPDGTVLQDGTAGSGGNDGSSRSESGASDAGSGASEDGGGGGGGDAAMEAGPPAFVCSPSPRPFAVASLEGETDGGGRQFQTNITLGVTQQQEARIIVQLEQEGQQQQQEAFRVYNVRWQPAALDSLWTFPGSNGYLNATALTPAGMTAVVSNSGYDGGPVSTLEAYPLPANAQQQSALPPPYPLTFPIGNFNGSATLLEFGMADDFVVLRNQTMTGSTFSSFRSSQSAGLGVPSVFANSSAQNGDSPLLVQGGPSVFAVIGSDPTSDAGVSIYKLPADGGNAGLVNPAMLPPNTLIVGAYPSVADSTKTATFAATLVTVPAAQLTFYAGLVPAPAFDGLQLSALTLGPSYGLHEVPVNKSSTSFINDQVVMAGLSPVASDQGINFVWMDSNAHVLGQAVGDTRLYNSRPGIQTTAVAAIQSIPGVLASFYVAWIEEPSDDAGVYDVLYVDQVQCAAP